MTRTTDEILAEVETAKQDCEAKVEPLRKKITALEEKRDEKIANLKDEGKQAIKKLEAALGLGTKGKGKGGGGSGPRRPTIAYTYAYYENLVTTGDTSETGFWKLSYTEMKKASEDAGKKCLRDLWGKAGKKQAPFKKKYDQWLEKQ